MYLRWDPPETRSQCSTITSSRHVLDALRRTKTVTERVIAASGI